MFIYTIYTHCIPEVIYATELYIHVQLYNICTGSQLIINIHVEEICTLCSEECTSTSLLVLGGVYFTEWNGSSIKCGTGSINHGMEVFEYVARLL